MALFSQPRRFGSTSLFTQCPVVIDEDTQRVVAKHRSEIWLWVLLDENRTGLQLLLPQVCKMRFVRYQEQNKKWWEDGIFTIRVLSRLTVLLTWAASLGWTSAVTCCNIYREYHVSVYILVFTRCHHTKVDFSRPITQIVFHMWNVTRRNSRIIWMTVLLNSVWCCLTCSNIMHILPLPLCGLYSIRAQNGYGPHRPCKIVLLTLVAPRGVTDLYLSWGINIERANGLP